MGLISVMFGSSASFRLADSRVPISRVPNSCVTQSGSTCVFPFKYAGVEYYQCTYADSPKAWCATGVDSTGTVIPNQWGDCVVSSTSGCAQETITVPSCTTSSGPESGKACVFPFRYKGVVYKECATVDQSSAWCSTEVDAGGNFVDGKYGFCPSTCPSASSSSTTTTTSTTTAASTSCVTSSGPAAGQACVFPFTFSGVTYNSCADWIYGGQAAGTTWCSTKVDSSGVHVNNEGNYGFCPSDSACTTSVAPKSSGFSFGSGAVNFGGRPSSPK